MHCLVFEQSVLVDTKRMTEQDIRSGLDAYRARADELVTPLPQELEPLQKFKDAVKRYERHFDGC